MPARPVDTPAPRARSFLSSRAALGLAGALLVLATLAAYANSFSGPFVFDDTPSIPENQTIRHLWPIGPVLATPHGTGETVTDRPVLNLSLALNYALGGTRVEGYHVVNLAIHGLAGLLLLGVGRRTLLLSRWAGRFDDAALPLALTIALLWTLHPLQTESVTYIIQRAESLMGLWYWLTLYAFLRGATAAHGGRWFVVAVVACLLGMATKEVMATAPLMILLYDRTFLAGTLRAAWRQRGRWHVALAATWILLAFLVLDAGGRGGSAGFESGISPWTYLLTQCRAIVRYLELSFWPHPLVLDYGVELVRNPLTVAPQALLLGLLLAGSLVALWRRSGWGFLGCWFFVILAPSSSIVPVMTQTVAEHRMYLPLAAVITLAVLGLHAWLGRRSFAIFAVVAIALGVTTARRNVVYQSAISIWSDSVRRVPDNARAHVALGTLLAKANRIPEATRELEAAVRLRPDAIEALNNLANAYAVAGRFQDALPLYAHVIQLRPGESSPYYNAGNVLAAMGRFPAALVDYQNAARSAPRDPDVQYRIGFALAQLGRFAEALGSYEQALRLRPGFALAEFGWGNALASLGRFPEAVAHYEQALRLQPNFPEAQRNLELVRSMMRRL